MVVNGNDVVVNGNDVVVNGNDVGVYSINCVKILNLTRNDDKPAFIHKLASLGSKSATSLFSPMLVFRKMCRNKDDDPFACLCNTNEI